MRTFNLVSVRSPEQYAAMLLSRGWLGETSFRSLGHGWFEFIGKYGETIGRMRCGDGTRKTQRWLVGL